MAQKELTRRDFLLSEESRRLAQAIIDAGIGEAEDGVYPLEDFDHNGRHKSETDPSFPPPDEDEEVDVDLSKFDEVFQRCRGTHDDS